MEQSIISSDSHVIEVPDLWEKGMPQALRERAPKVYFDEKRDAWMFGARRRTGAGSRRVVYGRWQAGRS